ncbi:MAG: hypothetical protein ACOCWL_04620 [Thermoguttaceae bacterium]
MTRYLLHVFLGGWLLAAPAMAQTGADSSIDRETLDRWSAPYRGWHYHAEHVVSADLKIPGHEDFRSFDVPTVYQLPGRSDRWYMSYIGFNGQGYNSFVAESTDLVHWTNHRPAMGFGPEGEFDHGGREQIGLAFSENLLDWKRYP